MAKVNQIIAAARVAHEANRAYCYALGDTSQKAWDDAPDWQQQSALGGVSAIAEGHITSPEESHASWMSQKEADGWKYGPVKDEMVKEHPCMVPYDDLPEEQRMKDALFFAIVTTLLGVKQ